MYMYIYICIYIYIYYRKKCKTDSLKRRLSKQTLITLERGTKKQNAARITQQLHSNARHAQQFPPNTQRLHSTTQKSPNTNIGTQL